ncbi:MAG: N-acetyltransferase, partial [Alphaproteobacteria bacterium]
MNKRSSADDASARLRLQTAGPGSAQLIAGLARRIHGESDDNLLSAEGWRRLLASPAIHAFLLWSGNEEAARKTKEKTGSKREKDSPIGFFILQISGEDAEILDLGLIPQVRGAGLGNELMSGIETICRAWN